MQEYTQAGNEAGLPCNKIQFELWCNTLLIMPLHRSHCTTVEPWLSEPPGNDKSVQISE